MADPLTPEPLRRRPRLRPLRWWWVVLAAALVAGVGLGVGWWLWSDAAGLATLDPAKSTAEAVALAERELSKVRGEAIRTGLTAAAGTGAALALLLAVRRQRATEVALELQGIDLEQKERDLAQKDAANINAWHDAVEKRITELYTKAVEQLGSEKAPVRLGGLHALERLAQGNEDHRQTIVDVICAYLRMPYDPPEPLEDQASVEERHEQQRRDQERQVRLTAQRILATHLRRERSDNDQLDNSKYWSKIDLDLAGATLIDFNLEKCDIQTGSFSAVRFIGAARFGGATFAGIAGFEEATFTGVASFIRATFVNSAWFDGATFAENARFAATKFTENAWFDEVVFGKVAWFDEATFFGDASFDKVRFAEKARFIRAAFANDASFDGATFAKSVSFNGARLRADAAIGWVPSTGWVVRLPTDEADGQLEGVEGAWGYLVRSVNAAELEATTTPDEAPAE